MVHSVWLVVIMSSFWETEPLTDFLIKLELEKPFREVNSNPPRMQLSFWAKIFESRGCIL